MSEVQRLDRWLWFARFFKSRTLASRLCSGSRVRLNRKLVSKASATVKVGDVLTFPQGPHIRVVRVLDLGSRRGPAAEARLLYEDLSPPQPADAATRSRVAQREPGSGRPTKRERRELERMLGEEP